MKQLTTTLNGKEILLVEVPEETNHYRILPGRITPLLGCYKSPNIKKYIPLPLEDWKLLGLAIDIIEPVAAELVESKVLMCRVFKDYSASELTRDNGFTLAAGNVSLATFVRSHHFNQYTTVLLIKE